ncbi:MAG TPA: four helix bundle protein [Pyrinomonadaceae bacterium]|jgi:four helix bundle protein
MKQNNVIQEKTFAFAVRAVKVYKYLSEDKKEFIISKQFLRSATSTGANIEEAIGGQSKADFIARLSISYKEAGETKYWIRLLQETDFFTDKEANSLLNDIEEILRIIAKIKISMSKT